MPAPVLLTLTLALGIAQMAELAFQMAMEQNGRAMQALCNELEKGSQING